MEQKLFMPFLGALRLLQPADKRGYLPPETIIAESIRRVLEKDKELERVWGREFYFVGYGVGCRSPEVDKMIDDGLSAGIIWFPQIDWYSKPGYNYLISHRGAGHLLRESEARTEDLRRLTLATHNEFLPTIAEHLSFFGERECQGREQALTIKRDLGEVSALVA